jgi:hypothetical protein
LLGAVPVALLPRPSMDHSKPARIKVNS